VRVEDSLGDRCCALYNGCATKTPASRSGEGG
jgi:hypothetical protein